MRYHKMKVCSESGLYLMESNVLSEADILTMANQLSRKRLSKGRSICSPQAVKTYLQNLLQDYEHEVFAVLLLDTKHKVLGFEELFRGSLTQASVYPREVVKLALQYNAAALIMTHNHPSGDPRPSQADIEMTKNLQKALALVDVRVLDHIVVGAKGCESLADQGCI
ncbi:DNA repair protein RadC [Paenalcaligenes hominis]|uniref:RadC family protein n=1 Tax=Paenalcaligenes hominis TaxID=643674 RepID=UPI003525AA21